MGLFRRAGQAGGGSQETGPTTGDTAAGVATDVDGAHPDAEAPRSVGPFDVSEIDDPEGRLDLGSLLLPGVPGLGLRLEVDRKTGKFTGVACTVEGSVLQIQAFAAPRTEGIWDEIRTEIEQSVAQQGGSADDVPGPFGRELLARLPTTGQDGRTSFRPARFVGVDGPRWFLRGVLTGRAAVDPEAAATLELVFANAVVVRGDAARPPRDVLELTAPTQPGEDTPGASRSQGAGPRGSFDPLERGPEITEIH